MSLQFRFNDTDMDNLRSMRKMSDEDEYGNYTRMPIGTIVRYAMSVIRTRADGHTYS